MKQIETLQLIRARCVELLEQAKLRTPGAWEASGVALYSLESDDRIASDVSPVNATYIANASVAFEAALESTVAAIDVCLANLHEDPEFGRDGDICDNEGRGCRACGYTETSQEKIITAWKHLLP